MTKKIKNLIWRAYRELGETKVNEFRVTLNLNDIPYTTFIGDSEKSLENIPVGRFKVYQEFFKTVDFNSLLPAVQKPSSLLKQEEQEENKKKLALEFGLVK